MRLRDVFNVHLAVIITILAPFFWLFPGFQAGAQQPVTPGYQVCSTASGSTICAWQPTDATHPLPVELGGTNGVVTGNASGTTGAVVGTLAAATGKTTYICGFDVSAIGGTAAVGPITVAGLAGSSMVYQMSSSATGNTLSKTFTPCIPGSGANTAITTTTTADGTATAVNVNTWGYQR